ncbi:MAG: sugar phosphate isomerase/epimerase [Oscillospiraceae bacterium]|nr:sugar phosphate isomerase/epimerase [Oscillospiraceae bacterium]
MKIAIQLYGLRDRIRSGGELLAILPRVKALGFDGVEFAGCFGLDAAVLRAALEQNGLVPVGAHVGLDELRPESLAQTLAFYKAAGLTRVGVGGAPHGSAAELAETCAVLKAAAGRAAEEGLTVYFHNHETEFMPIEDGTLPIDALAQACMLQVDTYWSFVAGRNNEELLPAYRNRICSVHIKDGVGQKTMALGEGDCDLDAVLRGAAAIGLGWLILENDDPEPDGLSDAARSMEWLRAKLALSI